MDKLNKLNKFLDVLCRGGSLGLSFVNKEFEVSFLFEDGLDVDEYNLKNDDDGLLFEMDGLSGIGLIDKLMDDEDVNIYII